MTHGPRPFLNSGEHDSTILTYIYNQYTSYIFTAEKWIYCWITSNQYVIIWLRLLDCDYQWIVDSNVGDVSYLGEVSNLGDFSLMMAAILPMHYRGVTSKQKLHRLPTFLNKFGNLIRQINCQSLYKLSEI